MKRKITVLYFLCIFICGITMFTSSLWAAQSIQVKAPFKYQNKVRSTSDRSTTFRDREIIVKFKEGADEETIEAFNKKMGMTVLSEQGKHKMQRMRTPKSKSMQDMLAQYRADDNVQYAEPNYTVTALMTPDDTYYTYQWHLDNDDETGLNCEKAWDIETGSTDVIVAVIDTGVAYEDYGSYAQAGDLSATAFVSGYDFVNSDSHPNDDNGHGTHVAGTIAQSTNNGLGAAGVAIGVSIMPIKVLNSNAEGSISEVADGIYYAVDNGAKVINLSLGSDESSQTLLDAVKYAYDNGVTVVAAAGNDGKSSVCYPAAFDDYVIAVGATRYDGSKTSYSNYGSSLDVMAPGGDLTVDQNNDGYVDGILQQTFSSNPASFNYYFYSGTSMASPHVAGVAALILSHYDYQPDQVRDAIETTARDFGDSGRDDEYGWGLVDAAAALGYTSEKVHEVQITGVTASETALIGETVAIEVTVKNAGDYDETVSVTLTNTTSDQSIDTQELSLSSGDSETLTFNWSTTDFEAGTYAFSSVVSTVENESNTENNESTFSIKLIEPRHDLAVTAFDVPLESEQGDTVALQVMVENQGTYDETVALTVTDTTTSTALDNQSFTLESGEEKTVTISWKTSSVSLADHVLTAAVLEVSEESDTEDNTLSQTITITEPEEETADIEVVTVRAGKIGRGNNRSRWNRRHWYRPYWDNNGYYIQAYIKSNEDTKQSITVSCSLKDSDGNLIDDSALTDKTGTIRPFARGYVRWRSHYRLTAGEYTATVSIPESGKDASATFTIN